jgi:hypothetical protein
MSRMVEELFALLDALVEKEEKTDNIVELLGGTGNDGYLLDEMRMVQTLIVKAFGGNEEHCNHLFSTDLFYEYRDNRSEENKKELIDYIELTIENDWTEEVGSSIIRM